MRSSWTGGGAEDARWSRQTGSWIAVALVGGAAILCPVAARADETIVVVDPVRPREDEAASASVVTSERAARSAETMADVLDGVPGVSVTRLGGVTAPALV